MLPYDSDGDIKDTESPQEDNLELLALPDNQFADGIANMIKFVLTNKKKPTTVLSAMLGSGSGTSSNALLLEDNTPFNLE